MPGVCAGSAVDDAAVINAADDAWVSCDLPVLVAGSSFFAAAALPPNNPSNAALAFTLPGVCAGSAVDDVAVFPPNKPSSAALAFTFPTDLLSPLSDVFVCL